MLGYVSGLKGTVFKVWPANFDVVDNENEKKASIELLSYSLSQKYEAAANVGTYMFGHIQTGALLSMADSIPGRRKRGRPSEPCSIIMTVQCTRKREQSTQATFVTRCTCDKQPLAR